MSGWYECFSEKPVFSSKKIIVILIEPIKDIL